MRKKYSFYFGLFLSLLALNNPGWADWVQDGGSHNLDQYKSARDAHLAVYSDSIYLNWIEDDNNAYYKHSNGSSWTTDPSLGENYGFEMATFKLSSNGTLNTSYHSIRNHCIKVFNFSSGWSQLGGSIYNDASAWVSSPSLELVNITPYVAWNEVDGSNVSKIYVKYWNGSNWLPAGSILNNRTDCHAYSPNLSKFNNSLYIAWSEAAPSRRASIWVKCWNGSSWTQIGNGIQFSSQTADHPYIAVNNLGVVYLAWNEIDGTTNKNQVYLKYLNGSNWVGVGGSLNISSSSEANDPKISFINNAPYVVWHEDNGSGVSQIYIKHYNGSSWIQDGGSLNIDSTKIAVNPSLTIFNGMPYVAWEESNSSGKSQIYLKHFVFPTATFTSTPTASPSATPSTTPTITSTSTPSPTITPTPTITLTSTVSPTPSATPIATTTITPSATATPIIPFLVGAGVPDFSGEIIDPKYFYVAPNPTKGVNVKFKFFLRQAAEVKIRIYTPQGSHVLTKNFNFYPQGWNTVVWNASGMTNGVYFFVAEAKAGDEREKLKVKKLALIK